MNAPRRHPLVKSDIEQTARYYEEKSPRLGTDFTDDFDRALALSIFCQGLPLIEPFDASTVYRGHAYESHGNRRHGSLKLGLELGICWDFLGICILGFLTP